ncbi:mevalonate kinase-like [Nylanderia fulva]|uniref:mevalonate kinase-like n=1 Tax=Nylanderia fulva TaxID=613905 RepID=UPI0010FB095E|nr:mevalonate kinase-like [Nylanderia fulva]
MTTERITFKISAPGRIVLSGEHSAMYRKHFVASSLNKRTTLEFTEIVESRIEINFFNIQLQFYVPLYEVLKFFSLDDHKKRDPNFVTQFVKHLITVNGMWTTFEQKFSLKLCFLMFYTIALETELIIRPFRIEVFTELPSAIGAGLGSSSAFAVCLATCFVHWKRLQARNYNVDNDAFLNQVRNYAEQCEEYIQDYGCAPIDTNICVFGRTAKIRLTNYTTFNIENVQNMTEIKILLIDSQIRQKKCDQAKQMANMKFESPSTFNYILDKLDDLAIRTYNCINSISHYNEQVIYETLQKCIRKTHQLLKGNNLVDSEFDEICTIANDNGFAAKLTGFGPGYVYILLPLNSTDKTVAYIVDNFERKGFKATFTSINCEGVRIQNLFYQY